MKGFCEDVLQRLAVGGWASEVHSLPSPLDIRNCLKAEEKKIYQRLIKMEGS
jgi:hypothetical protein